nr:uncharacterized protein LOC109185277 [Ipomoea batatas]
MRVNRTYPTIVGWSAELARKRVREENKAGSFGRGTVLPRISKPADIAAATSGQTDQPPVAALNIPSSSVDKVAGILQKLASTVGEFGEAMAEIGKQGAPVNVMRKTFSGLSNMLNVASTIEATATPTSSQLDDIFFGSESFTTAVDALNFYERMTYEIDRLENLDINDADLIFFPVLRHGHYFLICINVKASKLEIIDNKSLVSGVTMKDKYGDCTTLLVTALKEYLALGSSALFWKVDELTEEEGLYEPMTIGEQNRTNLIAPSLLDLGLFSRMGQHYSRYSFPVLRQGTIFYCAFNVKASKLEIFDNKSLVSGVHEGQVRRLHKPLFVTALEYQHWGHLPYSGRWMQLNRRGLVERTLCNEHMETYKRDIEEMENPGFKKKAKLNEEFLIGLRVRYAATIIKWSAQHIEKRCDQENQTLVQQEMNNLYSNVNV